MFKREELLSVEALEELTDEQINAIISLAQQKGDEIAVTKNKLQREVESLLQEIDVLKNNTKQNEDKTKDVEVSNIEQSSELKLLMEQVRSLSKELSEIKTNETKKTKKETLIAEAKEKGLDLISTKDLIDNLSKLGELPDTLEDYSKFIPKAEKPDMAVISNNDSDIPEPDNGQNNLDDLNQDLGFDLNAILNS